VLVHTHTHTHTHIHVYDCNICVQRFLLFSYAARHQHYNINPKLRLSFANGYLNFDFTKVIFSDECCVYIGPARKRVTHNKAHTHTQTQYRLI
jgi:hypothetical protein